MEGNIPDLYLTSTPKKFDPSDNEELNNINFDLLTLNDKPSQTLNKIDIKNEEIIDYNKFKEKLNNSSKVSSSIFNLKKSLFSISDQNLNLIANKNYNCNDIPISPRLKLRVRKRLFDLINHIDGYTYDQNSIKPQKIITQEGNLLRKSTTENKINMKLPNKSNYTNKISTQNDQNMLEYTLKSLDSDNHIKIYPELLEDSIKVIELMKTRIEDIETKKKIDSSVEKDINSVNHVLEESILSTKNTNERLKLENDKLKVKVKEYEDAQIKMKNKMNTMQEELKEERMTSGHMINSLQTQLITKERELTELRQLLITAQGKMNELNNLNKASLRDQENKQKSASIINEPAESLNKEGLLHIKMYYENLLKENQSYAFTQIREYKKAVSHLKHQISEMKDNLN